MKGGVQKVLEREFLDTLINFYYDFILVFKPKKYALMSSFFFTKARAIYLGKRPQKGSF